VSVAARNCDCALHEIVALRLIIKLHVNTNSLEKRFGLTFYRFHIIPALLEIKTDEFVITDESVKVVPRNII
jgi:hypothetical protein